MNDFIITLKSNLHELNDHLRVVIAKTDELHSQIIQYRLQKQIKCSEELAHMCHLLNQSGTRHEKHFSSVYGEMNTQTIDKCISDNYEDVELKSLFLTLRALKDDLLVKSSRINESNEAAKTFVDKTMQDMGVEKPRRESKQLKKTFYGR